MKTFTFATSAFFLGMSMIAVVQAAPPSDLPTAVVKFGDLDATRSMGQEELYGRLTRAARSVCRSLDPRDSVAKTQMEPLYKACIEQAVSGAVAKINRPEFADYVASRMQSPDRTGMHLAASNR